jgi:excisionase family DNA binding protein
LHEPLTPLAAPPDEFLTVAEVATLLRVHPATVRAWKVAGRLSSWATPGGHYRFARSVVQKFLAAAAEGPTSAA